MSPTSFQAAPPRVIIHDCVFIPNPGGEVNGKMAPETGDHGARPPGLGATVGMPGPPEPLLRVGPFITKEIYKTLLGGRVKELFTPMPSPAACPPPTPPTQPHMGAGKGEACGSDFPDIA